MIERWPDCNPELQVSKIKGKVFERLFKLKQNSKIQRWMAEKNSGSKAPGFLPQKKRIIIAAKEAQNKLQALCVSNAAPRSCWAVTQGCRELTDAQKWRVMGDGWWVTSPVCCSHSQSLCTSSPAGSPGPGSWDNMSGFGQCHHCWSCSLCKEFPQLIKLLRGVQ